MNNLATAVARLAISSATREISAGERGEGTGNQT
jgi:hypothetical protein